MRHRIKTKNINRSTSHMIAMLTNMSISLIQHEQIFTTLPKAKVLRPYIEKIITISRVNNEKNKNTLLSKLNNNYLCVKKLLNVIGPRYKKRPGGYTAIYKAGYRKGDCSPVAYIQLMDRDDNAKGKEFDKQKLPLKNNK